MVADDTDTTLLVTRSGRGLGPTQHRPRITVTSDRHDPSISHLDVLGEGYEPEDGVDINNGDAVLAINNKPDDVNALHDAGKLVEPLMKCRSAAIRVRGELADRIRMKRKRGNVVTPHRIDVLFDYLNNLLAHVVCPIVLAADRFSGELPCSNCRRYSAASKWPCEDAIRPSHCILHFSKPLMQTRRPAPPGPVFVPVRVQRYSTSSPRCEYLFTA